MFSKYCILKGKKKVVITANDNQQQFSTRTALNYYVNL